MKILVLGGTRFFGKRLVQKALKQGHEVTILSRGKVADPFGPHVARLIADRTKKDELMQVLKGKQYDCVVDQICMNATDMENAIEALKDKTSHYVLTSTLSVYPLGHDLKEEEIDPLEFTPFTPTNPMEEYCLGKRAAENALMQQNYFSSSIMRVSLVLAEDDYTKRLYDQVQRVKNGLPIYYPNPQARFSFVHADDAANALMWMLTQPGIFNISAPDQIAIGSLMEKIENVTKGKLRRAPSAAPEINSPFGIGDDYFMDVSKAAQLGQHSRAMTEWLEELIKRYATSV